jgi:ribA/ribD-fused uncharacterized protein
MIIDSFRGNYRFLSNFYPCIVCLDGVSYPSVENAYQAAKTLNPVLRVPFQTGTPSAAKRMGSNILLRTNWEEVKLEIMKFLLRQKFSKGSALLKQLQQTKGYLLVEGNFWHDNFWGNCFCNRRQTCEEEGKNHLGNILMNIRDENELK